MNLTAHTGLGRHIDLGYRSNRIAVFGTALAATVVAALRWFVTGEIDVLAAMSVAVGIFLAWAITRELDPDRPGSATFALAAAALLALFGTPAAAVVGIALIALRIRVGSVGAPLRPGDLVVLVVGAGYAGSTVAGWPVAVALTLAVAAHHSRQQRWLPPALATATIGVALIATPSLQIGMPSAPSLAVAAIAGVALVAARQPARVLATTDTSVEPISARRVGAARLSAARIVVGAALLGADAASLTPVVAALVGVATHGWWLSRSGTSHGQAMVRGGRRHRRGRALRADAPTPRGRQGAQAGRDLTSARWWPTVL